MYPQHDDSRPGRDTDSHPAPEALSDFVIGRLDEPQSARVEAHLDQCESCCQILSALPRRADRFVDELVSAVEMEHPVRPVRSGPLSSAPPAISGPASARRPRPQLPQRVGRFEIRDEIGQGGFGIVLRGYDPQLRREAAIKIPRLGTLLTPDLRERFLREAQAVAALDHSNIIPIYEAGEVADSCYIAGAYCRGPNLSRWMKEQTDPIPVRTAAWIVAELAGAVHHAHSRGVIHRDLKPSNVLLDPLDRNGDLACPPFVPKITDFGMAKFQDQGLGETRSDVVMGTAAYMSPEQARGQTRHIGAPADVYSLGAILYELLTGRPPIVGETELETIQCVQDRDPIPPARLRPNLPRDLATICLTCLSKEPRRRYSTAAELRDDLNRFLNGEPICARRASWAEKVGRWCRRKPALATLSTAVAVLSAVVVVGCIVAAVWFHQQRQTTLSQLYETQLAESESRVARQKAQNEELVAKRRLFASLVAEARARRLTGQAGQKFENMRNLKQAAELARSLNLAQSDLLAVRNEVIASLALTDLRVDRSWPGYPPGSAETGIAFDTNIERYAIVDADGHIVVRSVEDNAELVRIAADPPKSRRLGWRLVMRMSPDGNYLAARGQDFPGNPKHLIPTRVWDLRTLQLAIPPIPPSVAGGFRQDLDFSPDSRVFAAALRDGAIGMFTLGSDQQPRKFPAGTPPWGLRFSPDGRQLAVCRGQKVLVIDVDTGQVCRTLPHSSTVYFADWDQTGERLASVTGLPDAEACIWDAWTGTKLATCRGHQNQVRNVAFHRASNLLVTTSYVDTRLWDAATGRQLLVTSGWATSFSPECRWLGMGYAGSHVGRWESSLPEGVRQLDIQATLDQQLEISADGRLLMVSDTEHISLWNLDNAARLGAITLPEGSGRLIARFHPTQPSLFTCCNAGVHRWPIHWSAAEAAPQADETTDAPQVKIGPPDPIVLPTPIDASGFRIGSGGHLLLANGYQVWMVDPQRDRATLPSKRFRHGGYWLDSSADGHWLVTSAWQCSGTRLWDAHSGERVNTFSGYNAQMAFSPDNRWLVISNPDEYLIYEVGTWNLRRRIPQDGSVRPIVFSRDGRVLAIVSLGAAKLFNADTLNELATFSPPGRERIDKICCGPNSGRLVTKTARGAIHVWNLRVIHQRLGEMGLDWDVPGTAAELTPVRPVELSIDYGDLLRAAMCDAQLADDPENAELYYQRGLAHKRFKNWTRARADFEKTVELESNHVGAHFECALVYVRQGLDKAAIDALSNVLQLAPDHVEAYHRRGQAYQRQGKWLHALADLEQANVLRPDDWRTHVECGTTLMRLDRWEQAVSALTEAIELAPDKWDQSLATSQRAFAHDTLGQYAQAIADRESALKLDSENFHRSNDLAWRLVAVPDEQLRDPHRSVQLARQSLDLYRQNGAAWNTLGVAYYRQGKLVEAADAFEESMRLRAGGDSFDWFFLAMIHERQGQQDAARRWYQKAVQWMEAECPNDRGLMRFRSEAERTLEHFHDSELNEDQTASSSAD